MKAVILAAGKGSRLNSEETHIPKAMRLANGHPLLKYVLDTVGFIDKKDIIIVVGYLKEQILDAFPEYGFAEQKELKGTGHAVQCASKALESHKGLVLVLCGDTPTLKRSTIQKLIEIHRANQADCTILSCHIDRDMKLGRIVRDEKGTFVSIIETRDASEAQRAIHEYNTATYVFDCAKMLSGLNKIKNNNANGEYYLTDLPEILQAEGGKVIAADIGEEVEILGVNTLEDLIEVEDALKKISPTT